MTHSKPMKAVKIRHTTKKLRKVSMPTLSQSKYQTTQISKVLWNCSNLLALHASALFWCVLRKNEQLSLQCLQEDNTGGADMRTNLALHFLWLLSKITLLKVSFVESCVCCVCVNCIGKGFKLDFCSVCDHCFLNDLPLALALQLYLHAIPPLSLSLSLSLSEVDGGEGVYPNLILSFIALPFSLQSLPWSS